MALSNFSILLPACIALTCLCIVEFSLISSIVQYIHLQGPLVWQVSNPQYNFLLDRIPAHLHLDAGHVSNASAGLGFFVGLLGIYLAFAERRNVMPLRTHETKNYISLTPLDTQATNRGGFCNRFFLLNVFVTFAVIEFLLVMSALVYSFVYDNMTAANTISLATASQEVGQHYTEDNWSPGTWFSAVLALPLASESDRSSIQYHISVMKASKWMLVPIFITAFVVMLSSVFVHLRNRKERTVSDKYSFSALQKTEG